MEDHYVPVEMRIALAYDDLAERRTRLEVLTSAIKESKCALALLLAEQAGIVVGEDMRMPMIYAHGGKRVLIVAVTLSYSERLRVHFRPYLRSGKVSTSTPHTIVFQHGQRALPWTP